MIDVDRLTKWYGSVPAIRGMSFSVGRGEVVGLLGPNGAGKSTTMRILTTYLNPTSGQARLNGLDVLDEPLAVRRSLGYLPESVPLYPEMRAREFLGFRARLKDVPRRKRPAVLDEVIQRCGLEDVSERVIGNLSKGYRQRVGLADALLNDPPILILDEPTSGLDPLQVREVRSLIRELGERHTILLSTHIMTEVEAVCSRVLIVAGGKIALDEAVATVGSGSLLVEARGPRGGLLGVLETAEGVGRARLLHADGDVATCEVWPGQGGGDLGEVVSQRLAQSGWALRRLEPRRSTLEDRFVEAVRQAIATEEAEVAIGA